MVMVRSSSIAKSLTALFCLLGLLSLSVPIIDSLTGNDISAPFLVLSIMLTPLGVLSYKIRVDEGLSPVEALISSSIAWVVLPLISAIPLSLVTGLDYIDALFESVSGFTGTGLTVLSGLNQMKPSLLFWRALMQWTGELGFVVLAMVLFPFFYRYGLLLYGIERPVRIEASMYRTARRLLEIYLLLTIIGALMLYYTGMNIFDAIVHSMTGISTGGMSNYDTNYDAIYRVSPMTVLPLIVIMVLGATNFHLIDRLMRGELDYVIRNEEFKLYLALLLFFSLISSASVLASITEVGWQDTIVYGIFNAISALTTTGFSVGSIPRFPPSTKLVLTICMMVGGMTFATVGGIKVLRFLILLKKVKAMSVMLVTAGKIELAVKLDGKIMEDAEITSALVLILLHLTAIFVGASIAKALMPERDFVDTLFEATSAASCVGLTTGVVSLMSPLGVKITMMILMVLGRLEYLPVLLLMGFTLGGKTIKLIK